MQIWCKSEFSSPCNDLEDGVPEQFQVNTRKYANDCTMGTFVNAWKSSNMQGALDAVQCWADENKMKLNFKKINDMSINFSETPEPLSVKLGGNVIERVDNFKLLGSLVSERSKVEYAY